MEIQDIAHNNLRAFAANNMTQRLCNVTINPNLQSFDQNVTLYVVEDAYI